MVVAVVVDRCTTRAAVGVPEAVAAALDLGVRMVGYASAPAEIQTQTKTQGDSGRISEGE